MRSILSALHLPASQNLRRITAHGVGLQQQKRRGGRAVLAAALALMVVTGCGSTPPEVLPDQPVEQLYNSGMNLLTTGNISRSIQFFEEVERQHPYSVWATRSQIMAAYGHYVLNQYDEAIIALDRFVRLHPGNRDVAYAYYLKALSYYEQVADVERDQSLTRQAMGALEEVVRRFPDSAYAADARLKIDLTRDQLAGQEMSIGRWYQRNGEHQAAINRFRRVVDMYQVTSHVPEALHRLTESYLALGLVNEAQKSAAVLGYNFPGSDWYVDSYALMTGDDVHAAEEVERRGWLARTWNSVF